MKTFIINSKKAASIWGGIEIGYIVTQEEIKSVEDTNEGDKYIEVDMTSMEISNIGNMDMCVAGGISSRGHKHCIGEFCDFCGKFTEFYNEIYG